LVPENVFPSQSDQLSLPEAGVCCGQDKCTVGRAEVVVRNRVDHGINLVDGQEGEILILLFDLGFLRRTDWVAGDDLAAEGELEDRVEIVDVVDDG
jgi:hypothetical protein